MKNTFFLESLEFYTTYRINAIIERHPDRVSAFNAKAPTQRELKEEYGSESLTSFHTMWLTFLRERIKVKNNLEKPDFELIISTLIHEYFYLKLSEIALIYVNIAQGKFEPFYQKLDAEYVLRSFNAYRFVRNQMLPKKNEINYSTIARVGFIVHGLKKNMGFKR